MEYFSAKHFVESPYENWIFEIDALGFERYGPVPRANVAAIGNRLKKMYENTDGKVQQNVIALPVLNVLELLGDL